MDVIVRKFGGETREYEVYSRAEADELGLAYRPWREATCGEWALSDDGYVALCVRRKGPYKEVRRFGARTRWEVTLPYARRFTGATPLRYEEYRRSGVFGSGSPNPSTWMAREQRARRTRIAMAEYARAYAEHSGRIPESELRSIAVKWRSDQQVPVQTFQRWLKTEEAVQMLADELRKLCASHGITHDNVLDKFEESYAVARQTKNAAVMRNVAKDLAEMLDMRPQAKNQNLLPPAEDVDWETVDDLALPEPEIQLLPVAEEA
jgi:hypothetical protein